MEQQDKIHLLLSMQEHPEDYTDEQIVKMLADDPELAELMEQLAITKRAFAKKEADREQIPIDELWEEFAAAHKDELNALEKPSPILQLRKIAAVFISVILTAGVAFAAIHIIRGVNRPASQDIQTEESVSTKPINKQPVDTIKTDTIVINEPIVFDNIALETMLPEIAAYYKAEVEFQNEEVRGLRFYFEWKREETLEHVLSRLNRFETINIEWKDKKITVK